MLRHLKILEFALASLLRRKGKTLALLLVYAFTVAVLGSVLFLTQAMKREASLVLEGAPSLVVQRLSAGRHDPIPVDYAEAIRALPGVGSVVPRFWGYYYDALTEANYTLVAARTENPPGALLEGRLPRRAGECAVGSGVAELYGTGIGGEMILVDSANLGRLYEITGVFETDSALLTNDLIVLDQGELIDFFGLSPHEATDLAVEIFNPEEIDNAAAKIRLALPDTRPISRREILRTYDAVFNWRSGMMLTIFAAALVAFCILAWDKATGLSAEERREIGVLKAVGWDTSDVLALKFWEGAAVSLLAFLLGTVAAWLHVFFFEAGLLATVVRGWSVLFPAFRLRPAVDLYQIAVLAFLTIVPYVAATVIPSWRAATADPESVIRS